MADPISIAASILGLVSFGSRLTSILHTYIDNVKTARIEIIETAKELEALCLVLRRLERVYRPTEWDVDLKIVLDSCDRIFLELENVIGRGGVRNTGGEGAVRWTQKWRRLLWVLNEAKDVGRLKGHLEAHKATLSITLLVSQCSENASISESNERIERAVQEVRDMLQKSDDLSNISGTTYRPSVILENYLSVRKSCTFNYPSGPASPTSTIFKSNPTVQNISQTQGPQDLDDLESEEDLPLERELDPELPITRKRKRISVFLHHSKKIPLLSNPRIHTWQHPLHVAASNGDEKSVRELTNPRTVNSFELHGLTPLQLAASRGHSSVVKYLISSGAQVNFSAIQLSDTPAPLLEACEYGHVETVKVLLEAGADVEAVNPTTGARSLHLAARAGSEAIVKELVEKRADVEALDGDGQRPLHAGIHGGQWRVVRALLDAGAGIEDVDGKGRTPFEVAWGMNWAVGVDMLVKAGAQMKF